MLSYISLLCSVVVVGLVYSLYHVGRRPAGYPPGPPTIPIMGNLHQLAKAYPDSHLLFQKWAHEYGPIYSIILGTKVMMILSSDDAVKEIIDKGGAISSARPEAYIGSELASGSLRPTLQSDSSKWRPLRKVGHTGVSAKRVLEYSPYIDIENKQLMFDMLHGSSNLLDHLRRASSSLISSVAFGFRWPDANDPKMQKFFRDLDETVIIASAGLAAFADFFPFMRKIPSSLYPLKRRAARKFKTDQTLFASHYLKTKTAILNKLPTARTCLCKDVMEVQQQENLSDDAAAYMAFSYVEAGSETTASQLYAFVQAMLLYPVAQQQCQAEVDAICGDDRWPETNNIPNLPWIRACAKETLRWMPTAVIGAVPHALSKDTTYKGYHLPAKATLVVNVWTIHRDPARYESPEEFKPERYYGDDTSSAQSAASPDVSKRDHFGFGAGRRICPGTHLVDRSLAITMARMLWAFDIKPKIGQDGKPVLPLQDQFVGGVAVRPKEFEVEIVPRSEKRAEAVRRLWEEAKGELDAQGQFLVNPI